MRPELTHKGRAVHFGDDDLLRVSSTWTTDQNLNAAQARVLYDNISRKKEELLRRAVMHHVGHMPDMKKCRKYFHLREDGRVDGVVWAMWRNTAVAVYTSPRTRVENYRYVVEMWFRQLVKDIEPAKN